MRRPDWRSLLVPFEEITMNLPAPAFLNGLDADLQNALLKAIRNLWTHTSTALEGNTLSLGETAFVLEEGLTISGKPLKDHQEVVGHARAIDLLMDLAGKDEPVVEADLFALHRAVQTNVVLDTQCPIGAWKNAPNGTQAVDAGGQIRFIEYASPGDVPALMTAWLGDLNQVMGHGAHQNAAGVYADLHLAFVRIHPFCDGNGRLARLLTNLPLLRAGLPPIVIPGERRLDYLRLLSSYDLETGSAKAGCPVLPAGSDTGRFKVFCADCSKCMDDLIKQARATQVGRK